MIVTNKSSIIQNSNFDSNNFADTPKTRRPFDDFRMWVDGSCKITDLSGLRNIKGEPGKEEEGMRRMETVKYADIKTTKAAQKNKNMQHAKQHKRLCRHSSCRLWVYWTEVLKGRTRWESTLHSVAQQRVRWCDTYTSHIVYFTTVHFTRNI